MFFAARNVSIIIGKLLFSHVTREYQNTSHMILKKSQDLSVPCKIKWGYLNKYYQEGMIYFSFSLVIIWKNDIISDNFLEMLLIRSQL